VRPQSTALALVLAAGSGSAQSVIWTVDDGGGPGVAFTEIQPAVNAAGEGDTIFVRDGAYTGFTIDGKSLVVAGELGGTVLVVDEQIVVRNLAAGQFVLLQGIDVEGGLSPFLAGQPALLAENDQGIVRVEDGSFLPSAALNVGGGVWIDGSAAVHLARCDLLGGQAGFFPPGQDGFPALDVFDGTAALYDCDLEGAFGPGGGCTLGCGPGVQAGSGSVLDDSFLFASGGSIAGGDGGPGAAPCSLLGPGGDGGDGGNGLHLLTPGTDAFTLGTPILAGTGGPAHPASPCSSGSNGVAVQVDAGTYQPVGLAARSLSVTSPVSSGATITVDGVGAGGDTVFLLVSGSPGHLVLPALFGVLTTDLNFFPIPLGLLPPSGAFSLSVPTVPVPPSGVALHLFLQTVSVAATGEIVLGSFATLVLLT